MDTLIKKTFKLDAAAIKQLEETGTATIRFATIGVKDHDDDIMQAGAFTEGQTVTTLPTHQWGAQPLGKGRLRIDGIDVLADLMFNMDSQAAKEWHSWLKFDMDPKTGEPVQEWSWGWDWRNLKFRTERIDGVEVRIFEKVDVIEVSPVLRGAGSDTGTVGVKGSKAPAADTSLQFWSKMANAAHFKGADGATLHHLIDEQGNVGAASTKACLNEIAVLNGKRAGAVVNPAAKQAIYDHLAEHLKNAGIDAPALDLAAHSGLKFADEVDAVIDSVYDTMDLVQGLKARVEGLKERREADGRELSEAKIAQINTVIEVIKGLTMLETAEDIPTTDEVISTKLRGIHKNLA